MGVDRSANRTCYRGMAGHLETDFTEPRADLHCGEEQLPLSSAFFMGRSWSRQQVGELFNIIQALQGKM